MNCKTARIGHLEMTECINGDVELRGDSVSRHAGRDAMRGDDRIIAVIPAEARKAFGVLLLSEGLDTRQTEDLRHDINA